MRNLKRALSLALASVMLVGMMVVGTSAASFSDVDSDHNVEAISVLQALGVMNGYDDGGFHPDANVTRNQMAMIICALLGLDGADFTGYRPFTDVPDWAAGAVGASFTFWHPPKAITATHAAASNAILLFILTHIPFASLRHK